jgi:DNA repair exonuclease SbcCD ATPase subunit
MRLLSALVRNYRIHRELRVDFDPARTLIGGRNESGKSTLIEAIHRALFLKARVTGEAQKGMTSTSHPGCPEVELRFEAAGRTYHLRKRFSGGTGSTRLSDDAGRAVQDDEAERCLAELLGVEALSAGKGAEGRVAKQWAHLWVWQGEAGDDPAAHASAQQAPLLQRLQSLGGAAALQSERDVRVARHFAERYDAIFSQPGKPKARSDLARAEEAWDLAQATLQRATERVQRLDQSAVDLENATMELAAAGTSLQRLLREQREIESRAQALVELRQQETEQTQGAKTAADRYAALASANHTILAMRQDVTQQEQALAPQAEEADRLAKARDKSRQHWSDAEAALRAATEAARAARLRHELAVAQAARFEKAERHAKGQEKARTVEARRQALAALEAQWAPLPKVDRAKFQKIQKLEAQCSAARAALQAMATGLEVVAADQPVVAGDTPLRVGQRRILTEDTEVQIGPATRLCIQPGGGTSLAEARRTEQAARQKLQEMLDSFGLPSVEAATEVHARREDLGSRIQMTKVELDGLGADQLADELESARKDLLAAQGNLDRLLALVSQPELPTDLPAAKALVEAARQALQLAEEKDREARTTRDASAAAFESDQDTVQRKQQELERQQRQLNDRKAQLQLLLKTHGDDDARTRALVEAQAAKSTAEAWLQTTRDAIAARQPHLLETDRARLSRALEQKTTEANDARTRIAVARNALRSDGSEDPQATLADARAKARAATDHRDRERRKAAAIARLHELFQEEQRHLAEQFTQPLADKIAGYLRALFGAEARAEVGLENNQFTRLRFFRPGTGSTTLAFEHLSGGAKEQVAAAVRLAMAEVLAANYDGCLPVVFDDAFAYADPERVNQLQRMLDLAAHRGLQVIVLTCNPSDYAALGARTITLEPPAPALGDARVFTTSG